MPVTKSLDLNLELETDPNLPSEVSAGPKRRGPRPLTRRITVTMRKLFKELLVRMLEGFETRGAGWVL